MKNKIQDHSYAFMADHQRLRIHPVEVKAPPPPTAPLVAPGSSRSEKSGLVQGQYHPPLLRSMPVIHSTPPKRSCFCRCICWTLSLLVLLLIILAAIAGILYLNDGTAGTTADRANSFGSEGPCTGSHQAWGVEAEEG